MHSFWERFFWGNTIKEWTIAFSIIIGIILLLKVFQYVVLRKIKAFAERSKSTIDDLVVSVIQTLLMPLVFFLAIYFGLQFLNMSPKVRQIMNVAIMVITTFFIVRIITSVISYSVQNFIKTQAAPDVKKKQARGILIIVNGIVWLIALIFLVDNLGYDITTVITGLGIGGIAIALAAQTILGDLFSYLVIFFDKPFEIGDFIIVDDKMGNIEYIGIKTTRIRTLGGEQLICSNTDLTNSRVHNYKRMIQRRVVFSFGVVYHTSYEKLQRIPGIVKKLIEEKELAKFDRAHFKSFGNSSLDFEVVYYVLTDDYNRYMDIQQNINMDLFKTFEEQEIEFAFPTQTVMLDKASMASFFESKKSFASLLNDK